MDEYYLRIVPVRTEWEYQVYRRAVRILKSQGFRVWTYESIGSVRIEAVKAVERTKSTYVGASQYWPD